jgi:hypothetical protein
MADPSPVASETAESEDGQTAMGKDREELAMALSPLPELEPAPRDEPLRVSSSRTNALQTLTSGQKREIRGGALQAHICVVTSETDVAEVVQAFQEADGFRAVTSWSYAWRIISPSAPSGIWEGVEDGLDEGCGEKILGVLRRCGLNGLLLVVSRWQEYGASSALETNGTQLYSQVVERCKDLIANLKQAVGMSDDQRRAEERRLIELQKLPPGPKKVTLDFGFLPPLPEPRVPTKFGPNHFMSESHLNRPQSLPNLFTGGDVRLWMENDRCLQQLSESELWALRALRQPDYRIERILQAVAALRGQRSQRQATSAAARWGQCREVLRSATFRTEMLLFDASTVTNETARMALQTVDGLEAEEVRRVNNGAAALLEWVCGVSRWRLNGPPAPGTGLQALPVREAELGISGTPGMSTVQMTSGPLKRRLGPIRVTPLRRNPVHLIGAC